MTSLVAFDISNRFFSAASVAGIAGCFSEFYSLKVVTTFSAPDSDHPARAARLLVQAADHAAD